MKCMIGIDVGGTFTDFSLFDIEKKELFHYKISSTPDDPSRAIVTGILEMLKQKDIPCDRVDYLAHGTTVATNALIEHKGAKTALITTKGFKDLLEIGRQTRPSLYNLFKEKPEILVPGNLRCEVPERLYYNGAVCEPLDENETRKVIEKLKSDNIEAIAVCTLFSYINPSHEKRIGELIEEIFPGAYISVSHEVVPEFREYQRMSTTVVNAYLGPVMAKYVKNFQDSIKEAGIKVDPYITQSNGSIISISETIKNPVRTAVSGPSAGVVGAIYITGMCGIGNIITFDMGGTSADVSLIENGRPLLTSERVIHGYPVRIPMIDIVTVGAGGGSIAWLDAGGALKVGPESAGAEPGPACYGRGGKEPTVTDANVILGRLNPEYILDGKMKLMPSLSAEVIKDKICSRTGLSLIEAAAGIIAVVNSNMVRAIRIVSVERGYDPREFTLVAFGGAGPLHACAVANELGISQVFIPLSPGTLCSLGLLVADIKYDYVKTHIIPAREENMDEIDGIFDSLIEKGKRFLDAEKIPEDKRQYIKSVDARYKRQNYEITIPVQDGKFDMESFKNTIESFHREHEKNYGYCNPEQEVQFVNFRVTALGKVSKPTPVKHEVKRDTKKPVPASMRDIYFENGGKFESCPVFLRKELSYGDKITGPAVIEQMDSTILIIPGWEAEIDEYLNIRIKNIKKG